MTAIAPHDSGREVRQAFDTDPRTVPDHHAGSGSAPGHTPGRTRTCDISLRREREKTRSNAESGREQAPALSVDRATRDERTARVRQAFDALMASEILKAGAR